ncbi:MAG: biotin transporter BioY [Ruminococcus sp.]|nr:biotin transporter BioY [Ruminococcus sp.]
MKNIKLLTLAGVMTALTAVLANLSVPFAGIVLTLGVYGVFLTGFLLPPRFAVLSVAAYIILGLVGAPVFAGFQAGFGVLFGPTGGFLIAYPFMTLAVSIGAKNGIKGKTALRIALSVLLALSLCYLFGSVQYSFWANTDIFTALKLTAIPFIPFDIGKAVLAAFTSKAMLKITAYVKT